MQIENLLAKGNAVKDVFVTENFLLQSKRAVKLYHEYARELPIIDYHCHLPPQQIAETIAPNLQRYLTGDLPGLI